MPSSAGDQQKDDTKRRWEKRRYTVPWSVGYPSGPDVLTKITN